MSKEIDVDFGSSKIGDVYTNPNKKIPPFLHYKTEGNTYTKLNPDYIEYLKRQFPEMSEEEINDYMQNLYKLEANDKLLLSREELDKIESSQVFSDWLNGIINKKDLTEEEKKIIYTYQVYYDLLLSDDFMYGILDHWRCYGINDLLTNEERIETISMVYGELKENIRIKALLMLRRDEKERREKLNQQPQMVKKLTRKPDNNNKQD